MKTALLPLVLAVGCALPERVPRQPVEGEARVTVKTFNLNYGLAGEPETLRAIGCGDPDLILLQETSERWEPFIHAAYARLYPHMTFRHCCGAGGLAVLAKQPFAEMDYLSGPADSWFPALRIIADTALGPLQVLIVHLHPPATNSGSFVQGYFTTGPIRGAEMREFVSTLDPGLATVVAGDFNEPDGEAVRFLQDAGLRSGLPEFAPSAKTWRWELPVGSLSSRLDHIMYNRRLVPLNVEVLQVGRSDHLPVVATFALNTERPTTSPQTRPQRSPGSLSFSP